jgi:hypothetical protein
MIGNIGGFILAWSYLPGDDPSYKIGSGINVAAPSLVFLVTIALELWTSQDNKTREVYMV